MKVTMIGIDFAKEMFAAHCKDKHVYYRYQVAKKSSLR